MADAAKDKIEFMREMYKAFAEGLYGTFAGGGNEETFKYFDPEFKWVTAHNGWHFRGSPYLGIASVWDNVFVKGGTDISAETYVFEVTRMIDAGTDQVIVPGYY